MVRVILAAWLLAFAGHAASAEKRVALVVGNSNYEIAPALSNPRNDAADIAAALKRLNFEVTLGLDLTVAQFDNSVDAFTAAAKDADVALFFYSGHGVQIDKRGYLAPVNVKIESESSALRELVAIQEVVSRVERAAKVSVVVLDACRDSPLQERLRRVAKEQSKELVPPKGLPPVSVVGSNTLIVYATVPGETASDGSGRNSPFTGSLLDHIETPGLAVEIMFARVTADVLRKTGGKQQPERYSRLQTELVLLGPQQAVASKPAAGPQPPESEVAHAWSDIKDMKDPAVFEALRKQYGAANPLYDTLASQRVAALKADKPASESGSASTGRQWSSGQRPQDEKPGGTQTAVIAPKPAASHARTPVKIGILNDKSGLYTGIAGEGSVTAAKMAVEDFGAAGKGLDVTVVTADHQNKPDIAVNKAREWYDRDGVDAIFDVPNSSVALAISAITQEKNKIFIDSGAATSDLTGSKCSPNTLHWTYDTWELAHGTGSAAVKAGGGTWFFLTADYAFGHALERDTAAVVEAEGGVVLGTVEAPLNTQDFSSYLLQARASGAKVVGLANAGGDTINSIKQAAEFGVVQGGQKLAGLLVFISDVHSLGLQTAQGLVLTAPFYWDLNDNTRAFADRFMKQTNKRPTMIHAGVYSSVLHYLKAVHAAGSAKDALAVAAKMKEVPAEDQAFGKSIVRADGRVIHDSYLFEVKKPDESKGPWDYYKLISTTPAEKAFRPMSEGGCPLVAGK